MNGNLMMYADNYGGSQVFRATECCEEEINNLKEKIVNLEEDLQEAKLDGSVEVTGPTVNQPNSNLKMTGEVKVMTNVTGKSVYMDKTKVTAKVVVTASEDVEVTNVTVDGSFKENGAVFSINNAEKVIYKDLEFNAETAYNGIEVGLSSTNLPKEVVFENCTFKGVMRNNAISVFGMQEGGTITIKDCIFEDVSNVVRYSNKSNVKDVVMNIINCKVGKWSDTPEYAGLVICQDYTSKTDKEAVDNNLFSEDKLTINVTNTFVNNKSISGMVKKQGVQNTVVYVYRDKGKPASVNINDDENAYPRIFLK